jgi:polysaccharide chain length determinant protein (PEP-CTERM system associated)
MSGFGEHDGGRGPDFVLDVWHRRKWLAVFVLAGALAAGATITIALPDLYRATATVLVDRQEVSEAFVRPSVTAELETRIQTIHQRVMSRARLSEVILRHDLYPELRKTAALDDVVQRMARDIRLQLKGVDQASGRNATIAFTVTYSGRDPDTVADVVNTLVAFYVDENMRGRERQAARTAEFLAAQLAPLKQELDDLERRKSEFTLRHTEELPQQLEANLGALERLNTRLGLNGEYQLRAIERRERLEEELARDRQGPAALETALSPAEKLSALQRELAELRRKFSDQYPDVLRVRAELALLERQMDAARSEGPLPAAAASGPIGRLKQSLAALDAELQSLKDEEALLRRTIATYEGRVEGAPRRQREIDELSRGHEATRERYEALLKQYEDARLAASLEQGQSLEQFRVLDPAIPPTRPAAPNRQWFALMGLVGAVAAAIGATLAAEKLDTTFHTADDVRAFVEVPTLASIRLVQTSAGMRRTRRRAALLLAGSVCCIALIIGASYYVAAGSERIVRLTAREGV